MNYRKLRLIVINKLNKIPLKIQTVIFVSSATLVYFFRASKYILQPQLYAEDGARWLADAYNIGLKSLFMPLNGLFHLPERLFGFFVALLPLHYAPFIFNAAALCIFIVLTYYLFSPRTKILVNNYQRIFVLFSLGLIANVDEFFFNFSNSIFLLGIIGALILVAGESKNKFINYLEKFIFAITCFTLTFAWFYLPIIIIEKYWYKRKVSFYLYCAAVGSLVQTSCYLLSSTLRDSVAVTFQDLLSRNTILELYNQIVVPAIRFARIDIPINSSGFYELIFISITVMLCFFAFLYIIKTSNKQVRYLLCFFAVMTALSLKFPLIVKVLNPAEPVKFMAYTEDGDRYFIFGIIGLYIIFAKLSFRAFVPSMRYKFLAVFVLFGLLSSVHYQSFLVNKHYKDYRQQYYHSIDKLKSGASKVDVPVNPGWTMTLYAK